MTSSSTISTFSLRAAAWQWLLLFGVALAVRGSFLLEPPGRDQGLFWTQAELLLGGARLYDQVWEHKPPGILALYVGARALSSSYVAVHLLNAIAVLATALMLHTLCRRRGLSDASALFGALLYLLFAAGPAFGGYWMIAQPEVFLDPLLCAALLLTGAASLSSALIAGVAIGIAIFAIKYSALPLVLIALLQPARIGAGAGPRPHAGKLVFVLGSTLPLAALLAYFAVTGRAQAWFDITVLFNLEHARVGRIAFWSDPLAFAFPLSLSLLVFYVFALVAIICGVLRRKRQRVADDRLLYLGTALWLLALMQVALQGKFWSYHYHVLLLPLSLLAAVGFQRARALIAARLGGKRAALACTAIAALACSTYAMQIAFYARQHELLAAMRGDVTDEAFSLHYTWGHNDYNFGIDRIVAAQLAQTTRADESIFIWGFEPILYSLAQRTPASRFLYDYPLMPNFSQHARYMRQLLADLHAHPPALILVLHDDANDLEAQDSATQLAALPELASYLERGYTQTWRAGKFTCYAPRQ